MKNILIGLVGSSIMEGVIGVYTPEKRYYNILQQKLSIAFPECCFSIVNAAIGGESTREIHRRFQRDVLGYPLDICVVMYGANNEDLKTPSRALREHEFEELMECEEAMLPRSVTRVGVVLGPIIDECHWCFRDENYKKFFAPFGGHNAFVDLEREKAKAFYQKKQWRFLDLREVFAADRGKFICDDGIHLSEAGHAAFADALFALLQEVVKAKLQR